MAVPPRGQRAAGRGAAAVRLLARRLLLALPITAAVTAVVFWLASVAPFNPLSAYLGARYQHTSAAERLQLRAELGLDDSWLTVWWQWLCAIARGDWGVSRIHARPVAEVLIERLPYTGLLALAGLVLAIGVALLLALGSARRPGGIIDGFTTALAQAAQALPPFVVALVAIAVFALRLGMPAGGVAAPGMAPDAASIALHLVLPAAVLALGLLPWLVLNLRASLLEALDGDAVLAARGRGLGTSAILLGEALPLALLPFITVIGSRLGELVTGALLVETVFAWPGIASAVVEAAIAGDFALLAAVTACSCLAVFAGNALADAGYLLADPRVADV